MDRYDVVIVGAGIAGAGAAFMLSGQARVVVLEREEQPGYHSTGRSAALYSETYGNAVIRALAKGSRPFLEGPPAGFTDAPILTPRGVVQTATKEYRAKAEAYLADYAKLAEVHLLGTEEALKLVPVLRPEAVEVAVYEPEAKDIDVHALHRGYLRGFAAAGSKLVCNAEVTKASRQGDLWQVETTAGAFAAPVLVNAAGAWADTLAGLAGVAPKKIQPLRRTAFTFDPPPGVDPKSWPMALDVGETYYFKADAGRILGSLADETPSEPCDAQPDELDLAVAIDRLEHATTLPIRRLAAKWAGLRSFAPDRAMVAGFDGAAPGFFWLAGQGGYGIKTSPALGRVAAGLILGTGFPADIADLGATQAKLTPTRF